MKEFVANRLSSGNRVLPDKVTIDNAGVTLRVPGILAGGERTMMYNQINSVTIKNPLAGFSTVVIETRNRETITCHGFSKADAEEIKRLVQAGINLGHSATGGALHPFVVQDDTAKYEAQKAQAEVEQRKLDLEEQRNIEQRADQLRSQGKGKQAFFVEHSKTLALVAVIIIVGIICLWATFNTNSDAKIDTELSKKDEQIQLLIHDGKKEEALKMIGDLQHASQATSTHKGSGFMNNYTYNEYWNLRRDELRKLATDEATPTAATTKDQGSNTPVVSKPEPPVTESTAPVEESKTYTISVEKSYFYNEPNLDTKRKGYLIKGQSVSVTKTEGDFVFTEYTNDAGKVSSGWMLKSKLQ